MAEPLLPLERRGLFHDIATQQSCVWLVRPIRQSDFERTDEPPQSGEGEQDTALNDGSQTLSFQPSQQGFLEPVQTVRLSDVELSGESFDDLIEWQPLSGFPPLAELDEAEISETPGGVNQNAE